MLKDNLAMLRNIHGFSQEAIAEKMGVSSRTIQRAILALANAGIVKRVGSDRSGHWEVIPHEL